MGSISYNFNWQLQIHLQTLTRDIIKDILPFCMKSTKRTASYQKKKKTDKQEIKPKQQPILNLVQE